MNDYELEKIWLEFSNELMYEEDGYLYLENDFHIWSKNTEREEIWHWFDESHSKGVAWLLYEFNK